VIVYDHRGVGRSDAPKGPYSTRQFAQDAIHLLDALGVTEPAHVIGHSMGGRVCQWMAIDHPARVRSMIQAASGSGSMGLPDYPRGLTANACESLIRRGYREHMWHHFQSKFFFPEAFVKAQPEVLTELFKAFWDNAPKSNLTCGTSSPAISMRRAITCTGLRLRRYAWSAARIESMPIRAIT
jgi:pimeloyl-ACP methyl ester carboxylesterase